MDKDFGTWNTLKTQINRSSLIKDFRSREVWWASLGTNIGYEQDGTGSEFDRPVLILKSFNRYTCLIIPLTTSVKRNRYYVDAGIVDGKPAAAVISQIRLVDTRRLIEKIESLGYEKFKDIRNAVRSMI